jgi:hypothetical protein
VGALLVFYGAARFILDLAQDATYAMSNAETILGIVGSPLGNAAILVAGFFLLLWGRYTHSPETESSSQTVTTLDTTASKEIEQLKRKLRVVEQDRNQLRVLLADPTAKRRHEEEMLRNRCVEMAREVAAFRHAIRYDPYHPDTVERFKRRHYDKVTELRDELDSRNWLTEEERESLTLSEGGRAGKIERMEAVLVSIGTGH